MLNRAQRQRLSTNSYGQSNASSIPQTYTNSTNSDVYSTTTSTNNSYHKQSDQLNNSHTFDEMERTKSGEQIINLSGGISTTNVDMSSIRQINRMNTNPSDRAPGDEIYEDVFNPGSEYKNKMIRDMIKDVQNQAKYLCENDANSNEHRSYESQIQANPLTGSNSLTHSAAAHKRYMSEVKNIVRTNNDRIYKSTNNK